MATIQELESALINAHKAGDSDAARKLANVLVAAKKDASNLIPDSSVAGTMATPTPAPDPTIGQRLFGAGEAGLNTLTGMTGGAVGMAGGMVKGMTQAILDGTFGTKDAADMVERSAMQGAQALTYQPRTATGQQYAENIGDVMNQMAPIAAIAHTLPPMGMAARGTPGGVAVRAGAEGVARDAANFAAKPAEVGGLVAPGAAGDVAAAGATRAVDSAAKGAQRVASMAQGVTTLPRRALAAISGAEDSTPTRGTMTSGGSAGTDVAAMRKATADQLPVPMGDLLTKGDLTRDPAQQKFEVETAKMPEEGKPLRDRLIAKNQALLENFDTAIDQTGAEAPTLRAVGVAVSQALVDKAARAKTEIRARYKAAENAGEMEAPITLQSVVDHLNESAPDAATAPLLTTARARAIQTGMAIEGPDGQLIAQPITLKRAETFRQAVGAATDYTPTNIRQSAILKALVDEATQGMGGDLYRQARAARARYAQEFEDHAVISKLLNNKRGTSDRQVALEDVFNHAIVKGSLDDVRTVRKTLQTAGSDGAQAWKELQGATLRDIRDKATQSVALDSAGNRVLSPAALDKAINALDADGKLDFIFGKKGAQTLRDIREIAQISKTVSPEAAINHSNTAATLAAFADTVFSGLIGGPAPVATSTRFALQHIKDIRLRNRIRDALNEAQQKRAPNNKGGAPKKQAPPRKNMH